MTFRPQKKPALTLDASLVQDDLPLEVIPKVFIGSIHSAFNSESLHHNGITHILNASRLPITFPKLFTYLSVEIRDRDTSNILACIPTTNIFIEAGLENGGVLVHCFGGKSRSAAFVCAYMMSSMGWTFDEAYSALKIARPIVEINAGFESQLRAYHAAGCDVYVAQQLLLRTRIRALHKLRLAGGSDGMAEAKHSQGVGQSGAQDKSETIHSTARGLFLDTKESSVTVTSGSIAEEGEGMDVVNTAEPSAPRSGLPGLHIDSNSSSSTSQPLHHQQPEYDSFYYQRDHNIVSDYKPTISLSKLATQVEESSEPDFTFSKTRSISDVYEDSRDPCLDGDTADMREEEEKATYMMLQRKLNYVADSPSAATMQQPLAQPSSTGSLLAGFGALTTSTGGTGTAASAIGSAGSGGMNTGLGGKGGLGGGLRIGMGAGLSIGLSIGTAPAVAVEEHGSVGSVGGGDSFNPTRTVGVGFMQGSGNSAGNRTHRAGMQKKGGRKGKGSGGSPSTDLDSAPPACRLSRPGSTIVRVIPPLRGLERQFRCSWCNTALFTTANVLRTDVDIVALLENFAAAAAAQAQASALGANASERHSVDDYLAQEKARLSSRAYTDSHSTSSSSSSTAAAHSHGHGQTSKQESLTPPKTSNSLHFTESAEKSPVNTRTGEQKDEYLSPRMLPLIRVNSGTGANTSTNYSSLPVALLSRNNSEAKGGFPNLRMGSKEDLNAHSGGRFPPILNRSGPNSRNGSSSNLALVRGPSGSNLYESTSERVRGDKSGGGTMEMDIDSPPKQDYHHHGGSSHGGSNNSSFGRFHASDHDSDHENEIMAAPKFPPGGLKTSRAGNSRAFDFDIPMDSAEESAEVTPVPNVSASVTAGVGASANVSTPSASQKGAAAVFLSESDANTSGRGAGYNGIASRRSSHDDSSVGDLTNFNEGRRNSNGGLLPTLLHSKTSPSVINGSPRTAGDNTFLLSAANIGGNIQGVPGSSQKTSPRAEGLPHNPAAGRPAMLNVNAASTGIAGMSPSYHAQGSSAATFLHGISTSQVTSPHSTTSSARSDDSPSPRIHIPPHRMQYQQQIQLGAVHGGQPPVNASPRTDGLYQQYPRPQSAEKRRWLARMNLLHQGNDNTQGSSDMLSSDAGSSHLMDSQDPTHPNRGNRESGDFKVARMAEADDAASQLVYAGPEKYFHVEYLDWMGPSALQGLSDSGEICCASCKNVLGAWMWHPNSRLTMDGKLEAPLFRIHKHVVHQVDVQFDATPSSTPRIDEHRKSMDSSA